MRHHRFIFLFSALFLFTTSRAQDLSTAEDWASKAERFYTGKQYDSALYYSLNAEKWFAPRNPDTYEAILASNNMLTAGRSYRAKKDIANAHRYFEQCLHYSRKYRVQLSAEGAFIELNDLHDFIRTKDLPFDYPPVGITEQRAVIFKITKVVRMGDSIQVTIEGGRYDGITELNKRTPVVSKYSSENPERSFGLVNVYTREITNNYCIAMGLFDTTRQVFPGDLAELEVNVPVAWQHLPTHNLMKNNITITDNYRSKLSSARYLYYYTDSLTGNDINRALRSQLSDVIMNLAEDTLDIAPIHSKGLFPNQNYIRALTNTTDEHIRLFLGFVNNYPRKYIGNVYKFAEIYTTWVINNTPLAVADFKPYLIARKNASERQLAAYNLSDEITSQHLFPVWFNDGMLMVSAENTDSAYYMVQVIRDAAIALKDTVQQGWADYLQGSLEKRLANPAKADSCYKAAMKKFTLTRFEEGKAWTRTAMESLARSEKIEFAVQTGHLFPYVLAMSPNPRYMATGGIYDRFIKVWDVMLGREIMEFPAHSDQVNSLEYSPDGRYMLSASDDKTVKLWNAYDFSLIKTFATDALVKSAIFTPDSKQIVTGSSDSVIRFLSIATGNVTKRLKLHKGEVTCLGFLPTDSDYLFSGGTDSMVYKWELPTGDMVHWYKEKGRVISLSLTANGRFMATVSSDTMMNVWNLYQRKFAFKRRVHANSRFSGYTLGQPSFSPDSKLLAYPVTADSLGMVHLDSMQLIKYKYRHDGVYGLYGVKFSNDGNYLAGRLDPGGPLRIYNLSSWDFFNNSGNLAYKDIKSWYNAPMAVQFSRDDNELFIVHNSISKVDLRNGSTTNLYQEGFYFLSNQVMMNNEEWGMYQDPSVPAVHVYDYAKKKIVQTFSLPDSSETLKCFELSQNNRYAFLAGDKGTIAGYDVNSRKILFTQHSDSYIRILRYDSIRQRLLAINNAGQLLLIDPFSGNIRTKSGIPASRGLEVTPGSVYLAAAGAEVYQYDAATLKLQKKIKVHPGKGDCLATIISPGYKYLVVQLSDRFVTVDLETGKPLYDRVDHDYENGVMTISHNSRMLATTGLDTKVNMYELATGKKIVTIHTPRDKEFMITNADGYYLAPKSTLEAINFRYNGTNYSYEQFDTRFNRPDIIIRQLGRADNKLVQSYHAAYLKRLKKLHIDTLSLNNDVHLPVVRVKDKFALKPTTARKEYQMLVDCYDAKYKLRSLQVLVNNSSIFGAAGKPIEGNTNKATLKITVPLSRNANSIKVYCINEKGIASLSESLEISSMYESGEPKVYFIGIAVSNYKDTAMNLRYAAKDVRDLSAMFSRFYSNCSIDTLIDAGATRESILTLRDKLMKTGVNDKIIISVNGHGMLDDSLDFYYAPYDMDFKKPASRGLKYEDLEALLDGIPARKKLVLIDACHSGSLDKDELLAQKNNNSIPVDTTAGNTITGFASRGLIVKDRAKSDANNSYELMQNLFADLSAGNGAVIISAAGGMEYAFESAKWNNGVFTYCVMQALEREKADLDSNKMIDAAELRNYVSNKVQELTRGKQRPVSRRENIEFNWVVW